MRVGLQLPRFTWGGANTIAPKLNEIAPLVDQGGFYSLWVMDHFFQIPGVGEPQEPMLEGYSTLSYLAALTKHVKLGTLVTGVIYRYPGILVKTATTLDVLSGGRAYLGIGAAWFEREALGLGIPYPPVATRFEQLEEALQITHQMWAGEVKPYHGKHYQMDETLCVPMPISQPHPPIMIGGMGEHKTMRLIAKYADACNLFVRAGMDVIQSRLETIRRNCDALGRDYNTIERTTLGTVNFEMQKPKEVIAQIRQLADLGVQHVIYNIPNVETIKPIETMIREVIPAVAEL